MNQNKTPTNASEQKTFSFVQERGSGYGSCQDSRLQEEQWRRCDVGEPRSRLGFTTCSVLRAEPLQASASESEKWEDMG